MVDGTGLVVDHLTAALINQRCGTVATQPETAYYSVDDLRLGRAAISSLGTETTGMPDRNLQRG